MKHSPEEIWPALTGILEKSFPRLGVPVTQELSFTDVPGLDSLARIHLALTVEKAFAVRFTAREMSSLRCVGDLLRLVLGKTASKREGLF